MKALFGSSRPVVLKIFYCVIIKTFFCLGLSLAGWLAEKNFTCLREPRMLKTFANVTNESAMTPEGI
jgi:hypothetical protein